jgi:cysteine dioxygenase
MKRGSIGAEEMPMTNAAALSMAEFVREVRTRCGGALDPREMGRFLAASRIDPNSLEAFVRFAPGRYTRHLVHKDRDVELLVLCWARGAVAPIHGHEGEYCWARVERGRLAFRNYRETSRTPLGLEALGGLVHGGPGHVDGPADIHSVENPASLGEDAVSVHVYCRPYDECDIYDAEGGTVRRVRLSYDSVPAHLAAAGVTGPAPG